MNLGIVAESAAQLNALSMLMVQLGHHVVQAVQAKKSGTVQLTDSQLCEPAIWILRMDCHGECMDEFLTQIDPHHVPLMFDEIDTIGVTLSSDALRRFELKIQSCLADHRRNESSKRIERLWVLAASTGGPEAVSTFLRNLPNEMPGTAFLYVQHINDSMLPSLLKAVKNANKMNVYALTESVLACESSIYVVSPKYKLEISDLGGLLMTDASWSGDYAPSVNQVMAKVAKIYGRHTGAIVFSGMGDDGADSGRLIKRVGGTVWAQSQETCTIDSMPDCIINTGCVDFVGSPEELAEKFATDILMLHTNM